VLHRRVTAMTDDLIRRHQHNDNKRSTTQRFMHRISQQASARYDDSLSPPVYSLQDILLPPLNGLWAAIVANF